MSQYQYPELEAFMAKRNVKKTDVSELLKISQKAFYNKRMGKTPLTWEEACLIQKTFFPDVEKDVLFCREGSDNR
ncbi:MAG: hypothetical protein ACOX60_06170 [Massiliimalia sp.]